MQPNVEDFFPTMGNRMPRLVNMPAPKKPETFDEHVGSIVGGLARAHGGRPYLQRLMDWSLQTVNRRVSGSHGFTVKELQIVAPAINSTPEEITDQALKNYGNGSKEDGLRKLIAAEGLHLVSEAPISLDAHRKKTPKDMSEEELEEERSAANRDPQHLEDEPEAP